MHMSVWFLLLIQSSIMWRLNEKRKCIYCFGQYIFRLVYLFFSCMLDCIFSYHLEIRVEADYVYSYYLQTQENTIHAVRYQYNIWKNRMNFLSNRDHLISFEFSIVLHDRKTIQKEALISIYQEASKLTCWLNNRLCLPSKCR